jgi:drug/metabolite transporter (DMT)-like permease
LLVAGSAVGFAVMPILGKTAYAHGVAPFALLTWRFMIAAGVLWLLLAVRARSRSQALLPAAGQSLRLLALGGLLLAFEVALYFLGLQFISAGLAEVLLFLFPAWVVVAVAVGRRRLPSLVTLSATLVAVAGAALTIGAYTGGGQAGDRTLAGVALLLGASVSYAAYVLIAASFVQRVGSLRATTLIVSGAAVSFGLVALLTGAAGPSDAAGYAAAVAMAVVSTVAAFGLLSAGLSYLSASHASVVATLEPVLAVVLGAVLLAEQVGPLQVIGMVMVLAAVALILWRDGETGRSGDTPGDPGGRSDHDSGGPLATEYPGV